MPTFVTDPQIEKRLLKRRRAWGADKFDEVWDGVYVMAPLANIEHQQFMISLGAAFVNAFAADPNVRGRRLESRWKIGSAGGGFANGG